jgi:hypothetical protein
MENHDLIVGSQPHVAFYTGVRLERCSKGGQAVFGEASAMMQPAVREACSAGIERIRA